MDSIICINNPKKLKCANSNIQNYFFDSSLDVSYSKSEKIISINNN